MGTSALELALEKSARASAGYEISEDGSYYWDEASASWLPLDAYGNAGEEPDQLPPPPRSRRPSSRGGSSGGLLKLGLGVVAVGAIGYALWRR